MNKTIEHLQDQLKGIRWGSITSGLVDTVRIPAYGSQMELRSLAYSEGDAKRISVTPYDPTLLSVINTALNQAGFNAYIFSKTSVVVSVPQPCGEEREKVIRQIQKIGEESKIAIRNIRKKARKELEDQDDKIQKITDLAVSEIERMIEAKCSLIASQ